MKVGELYVSKYPLDIFNKEIDGSIRFVHASSLCKEEMFMLLEACEPKKATSKVYQFKILTLNGIVGYIATAYPEHLTKVIQP